MQSTPLEHQAIAELVRKVKSIEKVNANLIEALQETKRQLELAVAAMPLEKLTYNMSAAISIAALAIEKAETKAA